MAAADDEAAAAAAAMRAAWVAAASERGVGTGGGAREFFAALDWTDPFLAGLVAAHLSLLAAVVAFRSNQPFQLAFLVTSFTAVRCGEAVNKVAAAHWRSFAARDYFDAGGAFYAAAVAAPLLGTVCVQLALQLASAWRLAVRLKAAQIRRARRGVEPARPRTRSESRKRQ